MSHSIAVVAFVITLGALAPSFAVAQPNDECAAATVISKLPSTQTLTLDTVTFGAGDPAPTCAAERPNVWYTYTARADLSLELDTAGSSSDTSIAVYSGECGALTEIACNAATATAARGHVVVLLRKGQTVRIAVASEIGTVVPLVARQSAPRYQQAGALSEIVRPSHPSAFGGSQGSLLAAVPLTQKTTAFTQSSGGIFADVGGTLTMVAHSGAPSPVGGTFVTLRPPAAAANGVFFVAEIDGGSITRGIFRWAGGDVTLHLGRGGPGPEGTTLRNFGTFLAASETGTIAFLGRTQGDPNDKLLLFDGVTTTLIAAESAPTPCGGTFRDFESAIAIDDAGTKVAFVAGLSNTRSDAGLFVFDGTELAAVVCQGDPTPLGGTHGQIGPRPAINAIGEVYFATSVPDSSVVDAVWRYAAGVTSPVATRSTTAATGESIRRLPTSQQLATDPFGDVVFVADLVRGGRAIMQRAPLATLPSVVVRTTEPCPLGGTFEAIEDELDLSSSGELVFDAHCSGGHGAFRKPAGGAASVVASYASPTAIGSGFSIGRLSIDATGSRIAGSGGRVTLQSVSCTGARCRAPVGVAAPSAALANVPDQRLAVIDSTTLAASSRTLAFVATTVGVDYRSALLRLEKGKLDALGSPGDTLPGGVGTFDEIPSDALFGDPGIGVGTGVVAFTARLDDHPTASQGLFAATSKRLTTIALANDAAPRGEAFEEFDRPVVRGRSIVFLATTRTQACIFATEQPGKAIAAVTCVGDPAPPPIGGAIGDFLGSPSGSATELYVPVAIAEGNAAQCLLRYRKGTASVVRCAGDVFPDGGFYESFDATTFGPITDATVEALLFLTQDGSSGRVSLMALRRDTLFPVLVPGLTAAPESGGTIATTLDLPPGIAGKSVVLSAGIVGGTAPRAIFRAVLP